MNRTRVIVGPPGTGKTTWLLDRVDDEISSGTRPDRIAFVSFTRKAAGEAAERARERFSLTSDDLPWFRTLHSAAYRILGLRRSEVMTTEHFREVAGDLPLRNSYDHMTERAPDVGGEGDRCIRVISMARSTMSTVVDAHRAIDDSEVAISTVERFDERLRRFKHERGLLDFSDFLDRATEIDVDVVMIDEAQDLTRQQWAAARVMFKNARKVYIAGDDDQAIYEWAGADPTGMSRFVAEYTVLNQSRRIPRLVHDIALSIIRQVANRREKKFRPRDEEGAVSSSFMDEVDFSEGTWLVLARNKKFLWPISRLLDSTGIPHMLNGRSSVDSDGIRAVLTFERMRRGEVVDADDADDVAKRTGSRLVGVGRVSWADVEWSFEGRPSWKDLHDRGRFRINDADAERIRNVRARGESLTRRPRINLSTIHAAKGGEADNVAVLPDMSRKSEDSLTHNPGAERRVWYVAATRTRNRLVLPQPNGRRHFRWT